MDCVHGSSNTCSLVLVRAVNYPAPLVHDGMASFLMHSTGESWPYMETAIQSGDWCSIRGAEGVRYEC